MTDILTPEERSRRMSSVRQRHTRPEKQLRSALWRRGARYKLHDGRLPGTPDIVFVRRSVAVQVRGCFWHGHACRQGKLPSTNVDYWGPKILANRRRDRRQDRATRARGWSLFVVWECQLKSSPRQEQAVARILRMLSDRGGQRRRPQTKTSGGHRASN